MNKFVVFSLYNLLLPLVFLLGFPGWVLKMYKRGGFGTGLLQRLGYFKSPADLEKKGGVYIHAVSVGEVIIALKLIKKWAELYPEEHFVLVPTTATGHAVAKKEESEKIRVIYSPVDFGFVVKKVFNRFKPKQLVLIESEMWPNLLNICEARKIPVSVVNTRLSERSEGRFMKFRMMVQPIFQMVDTFALQEAVDVERWVRLGVERSKLVHVGSVKYDFLGGAEPSKRADFEAMLTQVLGEKKRIMCISTFPGEELAIAQELKEIEGASLVFVPRHAERGGEVARELKEQGFDAILRSDLKSEAKGEPCFVINSTGELRDWTAHADVVIVGKSWLSKGGQNPTEAIAAMVPVVLGPRMDNFEPLVSSLVKGDGVVQLDGLDELRDAVLSILENNADVRGGTSKARELLKAHDGATERTVREVACLLGKEK